MIHPEDAGALAIANGDFVAVGNLRGEVRLHARLFDGVRRGVAIAESIWPNAAYRDGRLRDEDRYYNIKTMKKLSNLS